MDLLESTFPKTPLGGTAVGLPRFRLPRDPSLSPKPSSEEPRSDLLGSDFPATTLSGAAVGPPIGNRFQLPLDLLGVSQLRLTSSPERGGGGTPEGEPRPPLPELEAAPQWMSNEDDTFTK